ncbi:MAG: DUF4416 family protein, partial [Deltaproteobacteria bacterium]|nr:DUF4416 family protein [Deltaproteobacteria bacterium]
KPAKLIIGLFLKQKQLLDELADDLCARFGAVDIISGWLPFDFTSYYAEELGAPLFRRLFSFEKLIQQDALAKIKLSTNQLEHKYSQNGKRRVNIDPGYMLHERFVLASGKNFSHRIYLNEGVYADLTLIYHKGGFQKLPWTYPDYTDPSMQTVLERMRRKYILEVRP